VTRVRGKSPQVYYLIGLAAIGDNQVHVESLRSKGKASRTDNESGYIIHKLRFVSNGYLAA
jgi:hypothetical protein